MQDLRDQILATPRDIEDLAQLGRELKTCPYYGSRRAIRQAEVGYRIFIGSIQLIPCKSLWYFHITFCCKSNLGKL
jgi:hypothetical protein